MKRWGLIILLLSVGTAYALGRLDDSPGPPLPVLPPDILIDHKVDYIPIENPLNFKLLGKLETADDDLKALEEKYGVLVKVVERLHLETAAAPIPKPVIEQMTTVIEKAADLGTLFSRMQADVDKFEGMKDGKLQWGFKGHLGCELRADPEDEWTRVAYEPISLLSSTAITTQAPVDPTRRWTTDIRLGLVSTPGIDVAVSVHKRSRIGWYAGFQYDIDPETFESIIFDPESEGFSSFSFEADKGRIYGGVELRIGRR